MAEELSAKLQILPDESSAASAKFTRKLSEVMGRIPDSKLPKIAVQIDVKRTKAIFQKQLKDIMKSMSLDTSSLYKNSGSGSGGKSASIINELKLEAKQTRDIATANERIQRIRDANHIKLIKQQKEVKLNSDRLLKADTKASNLYSQFLGIINKNINYKKSPELLKEAKSLKLALSDAFDNGISKDGFDVLQNRVSKFHTTLRKSGLEAETWGQKISRLFRDHFNTAIAMAGIHLLRQSLQQMIGVVQELDKSLVNIQMVTGGTRTQAAELMKTYNQMGKELGATTAEVSTSANEWLRQGKSIEETNKLIEASMVLSKIGMLSSAESTQYLTASMRGYKVAVDDVMSITDKVSKVDMISATSASGLMEGMSRVANFANDVGYSMDKLLATIATIGEVTQREMSTVGDSLRTQFARMSNIKLGKLVDDETGESLSDVETSLNLVGIKLRENETDFRNYGDVMDEVASKWSGFNDVQKNMVATSFAGARRIEDFRVLMSNYDNVLKYTTESLGSAGSAQKKFSEAYQSGIEKSSKSFTAAFESLSTNIINSELFKFFIDLGTKLLEIINIGDGILIKITAIIAGLILIPPILKTIGSLTLFTNMQASLAGVLTFLKAIPVAFAIAKAEAAGFAGVLQLLNINPVMLAITALIAVTVGAVALFNHFNVTVKEAIEAAKQAQQEFEQSASEIKSINDELKTTQDRIDVLNSKDKLTFTEKDELQKLKDTNKELKVQLELAKQVNEVASKKATDTAVKLLEKYSKRGRIPNVGIDVEAAKVPNDLRGLAINESDAVPKMIKQYKELNSVSKPTEKQIEQLNKLKESLTGIATEYQDAANQIVPYNNETETAQKNAIETRNLIVSALSPELFKEDNFNKVFNKFADAKKTLAEIVLKTGEISKSDISKIGGLKTALDNAGLSTEDVVEQFNAMRVASDESAKSLKSLSSILSNLSGNDEVKALSDAFKELESGQTISIETMATLLDSYPDLIDYIDAETGAINLTKKALVEKYNIIKEEHRNSIIAAKQSAETQLKILKDEWESIPKSANFGANWSGVTLSDIKKVEKEISRLNKELKLYESYSLGYVGGKSSSSKSSDDPNKDKFDAELTALKHNLSMKKISEKTYYNSLETLYKKYFKDKSKYQEEYWQYEEEVFSGRLKLLEQAKDKIISLQNMVIAKIKQAKNDEKKALQEQLDGYKKLADARKKALQQLKDEHDYQKSISEKEKDVSDIKSQLVVLESDDSAWATKRKIELRDQLAEKQEDLDEYLYDQSIQRMEDEIDAEYETQETLVNNKIEKIEEYLDNQELLMNDSMKQVQSMSNKLYGELVEWNKKYGDGIKNTVTTAWNDAKTALQEYKSLANIESKIAANNPTPAKPKAATPAPSTSTSSKVPKVGETVTVEKSASKWITGEGIPSYVKGSKYQVIQVGRGNDKNAILIGKGKTPTGWINKSSLEKYHTGLDAGFVGGTGNEAFMKLMQALSGDGIKANEKVSLLQNGESVITRNQQANILKNLTGGGNLVSNATSGGINLVEGDIIINGNATDDAINQIAKIKKDMFNDFKKLLNSDIRGKGYNINAKGLA